MPRCRAKCSHKSKRARCHPVLDGFDSSQRTVAPDRTLKTDFHERIWPLTLRNAYGQELHFPLHLVAENQVKKSILSTN